MNVYWMEQTQADLPATDEWLNANEITRLQSMRIPKRRGDWRLGRWTAKQIVARHFGLADEDHSLREIEIRSAPSGVPEVFINDQLARVSISLSHRGGTAMCAIAENSVALGCDVEMIEPHSGTFVADYFTEKEQVIVFESSDHDLFSSLLWSAKESALKALGTGLRVDTRCVDVEVEQPPFRCDTWGWLRVGHISGEMFHGWWQRSENLIRAMVADPAPDLPIAWPSRSLLGHTALSVMAAC